MLRNISFVVEPGESVAFVGRSGSGKSTLVALLPRFYEATEGAVLLDGRDIRDYPLADLRRQFASGEPGSEPFRYERARQYRLWGAGRCKRRGGQ